MNQKRNYNVLELAMVGAHYKYSKVCLGLLLYQQGQLHEKLLLIGSNVTLREILRQLESFMLPNGARADVTENKKQHQEWILARIASLLRHINCIFNLVFFLHGPMGKYPFHVTLMTM